MITREKKWTVKKTWLLKISMMVNKIIKEEDSKGWAWPNKE